MPTQKIDPKVIFASNAPAVDKPPVFGDKTKGWDVTRANDGRPTIKEMNKVQQDTDLKILWLNENSVTPYDASIDYPDGAVTIKDGSFKQLASGAWVEFLDDFADKDAVKRGIANRYDSSLTYNSGERVALTNGDIVKSTIDGNANNPNSDMTGWVKTNSASQIFDESGLSQQEVNNKNNTISYVALMLDSPVVDGKIFNVLSRDEPNFALVKPYSGGGLFKWDVSSTATPNGGTVFAHNTITAGRFLRIIDSDVHTSWFAGHGWTNEDKTARVQQAIDFANRLDGASALCVDGKYKITSSLMIDRKTDTTKGDFIVYGTGNNDGFLIDTPITMFSSRLPYNPSDAPAYTKAPCSEFTIFKVIDFEATTADLNNCVFDDKFLRLTFDSCTHRKMRGCKSAEFLQSIKYIGKNKFRQHTGYFIEAVDAYDFRVNGAEFENSGRGFKFTGIARGSYFDGNLYQGSGGHFVAISGLFGGSVSKNYFEANADQDIVLGINGGVSSGEINGNLHYLHTEQLADPKYYPVSLGFGRNITVSNCLSNGNLAHSGDTSALEITEFGNTVAVNRKVLSYDAKEVTSFSPLDGTQETARVIRNTINIITGIASTGAVRLPALNNAGSHSFLTIKNNTNVGVKIFPAFGERILGLAYNDPYVQGSGEIKLARSTSDYWTII